MPALLTIETPGKDPVDLPIGNTATIGRTPANDIVLEGDPLVSRQHAVIRCQNGAHFQLIDLGSRNGTFAEGRQVVLPATLRDGSRLQIGRTAMTFRMETGGESMEEMELTLAATMPGAEAGVVDAAILVCDIRSFSTFSEQLPPGEVAQFIGKWFLGVGEIVDRHRGQIDKFIGDAVLAYWTGDPAEACKGALDAAAEMESRATGMAWPKLGNPVQTAIALHHGTVSCGNIGTIAQRDATILGDAVNTVFRLESVMKTLGVSLLCSEAFYQNLPALPGFEDLGETELKGKSRPVRVFGRK